MRVSASASAVASDRIHGPVPPSLETSRPNARLAMTLSRRGDSPRALYAALHGDGADRAPGRDRAGFLAADRTASGGDASCSTSPGSGRLLGDAASIAEHLARAGCRRACGDRADADGGAAAGRARTERTSGGGGAMPRRRCADVPLSVLQQLRRAIVKPQRFGPRPAAAASTCSAAGGLTTLGELAALPAADLSARLGAAGVALQRLARGRRSAAARARSRRAALHRAAASSNGRSTRSSRCRSCLARLLDPLSAALERADRGAAALRLRAAAHRSDDARAHAAAAGGDARSAGAAHAAAARSRIPSAAAAIDIVTIEVDPAPGRVVQYSLLERALPSAETLATLMARLGALVGESRCGSPALLDTHRPDGSRCGAGRASSDRLRATRRCTSTARAGADARRPWCCAGSGRRWPFASPSSADGRCASAIDRRGMPGGTRAGSGRPWRSSGAWWRSPALESRRVGRGAEAARSAGCSTIERRGVVSRRGL